MKRSILIITKTISIISILLAQVASTSFAEEISIMTYNTQNTFDAIHDDGKDDYTFLPLNYPDKERHCYGLQIPYYREFCLKTDWTAEKSNLKVEQLKRMITHQGFLPDVVALQEVENSNILGELAKTTGYEKFVITESPDKRGIDVAVLFNQKKLTYIKHEELMVWSKELEIKTRNILRVEFKVNGTKDAVLAVYVNHWPSQQNPKENRLLAADILKQDIISQRRDIGKDDYYVVAVGDFNTTERETPNSITDVMTAKGWNSLVDVQEYTQDFKGKKEPELEGTYFYASKLRWERIDRILVSKNMLTGKSDIELMPNSFKILKPAFAMHDYTERRPKNPNKGKVIRNVPIPYNFDSTNSEQAGFSDHLPVFVKLSVE